MLHCILLKLHNHQLKSHTKSPGAFKMRRGKKHAVYRVYKRLLGINGNRPALGVGQFAPLDTGQGIIQLLGQLADLAAADMGNLALPIQLLDGGNDSSRAGAKDLFQLALVGSLHDVSNGNALLMYLVAPILQQLDDGTAGSPGRTVPTQGAV